MRCSLAQCSASEETGRIHQSVVAREAPRCAGQDDGHFAVHYPLNAAGQAIMRAFIDEDVSNVLLQFHSKKIKASNVQVCMS